MELDKLDKDPSYIAAMFDKVAKKYDRTNDIISFGQARLWRKFVAETVSGCAEEKILDVAAGTGSSSASFLSSGCKVVACDFSKGMLDIGRYKYPGIEFVFADATNLPFEDNSFDAVTISFGLRNVENPQKSISEMLRVVKPLGRVVICEFSHPEFRLWRNIYLNYLMKILPFMARIVSSEPQAYEYLAQSIRQWPDRRNLAQMLYDAGWRDIRYASLSGGIVAVHYGIKY